MEDPLKIEPLDIDTDFDEKPIILPEILPFQESKKRLCKRCNIYFDTLTLLQDHRKQLHDHKPPKTFACTVGTCKKLFATEKLRRWHEEVHEKTIKHFCHVCETPLRTHYQLLNHKYRHAKEDNSSQGPHVPNEDDKNSRFICDTCGKSFSQLGSLNVHKKVHAEDYKPPVVYCEFCPGLKWNSRTGLKHHLKRCHEKLTHLCDICGKALATGPSLKNHMMIHKEEKPHVCSVCKKGFKKKDYLDCHMRVHTKEKPFSCKFCEKSYSQQCSLRMHIRTAHEKQKPHACTVCSKSFNTKTLLNAHLKTH